MSVGVERHAWGGLVVVAVPALSDNYMYLIADENTKDAAVVDPVKPELILDVAAREGFTVRQVFTTHNHWDHAGGNSEIAKLVPGIEICGGKNDDAEAVTKGVGEGDGLRVGDLRVDVIDTPCHTKGHVCYVVHAKEGPQAAFTGDTLFVAGCGNFNTGTPKMMHDAFQKLGNLPLNTKLFVGHEYTLSNLQYAQFVEPQNPDVAKIFEQTQQLREQSKFSVPSTVQDEHKINPFMRAVFGVESVLQHCRTTDRVDALRFVRQEKSSNTWKA